MELLGYDGKQWRPMHFEEFTGQFIGTPAVRCGSRKRTPVGQYQSNLRAFGGLERLSLDLHGHEFCTAGARPLGVSLQVAFTRNRIGAFGRSTAGSSAVEFAFAAPILLVLMFAVIEFGRAWWTKNALQYAVERAVRYAVICNGACPGDGAVATYAANQVYNQSIGSNTFTITHPAGATCVSYSFNYSPWFVGEQMDVLEGPVTLTGTSCRSHS